jgi:hypothetical protein
VAPLSIQFPDLYLCYDFVEHHIIKCKKTTEIVNRDRANFIIFPFQDLMVQTFSNTSYSNFKALGAIKA